MVKEELQNLIDKAHESAELRETGISDEWFDAIMSAKTYPSQDILNKHIGPGIPPIIPTGIPIIQNKVLEPNHLMIVAGGRPSETFDTIKELMDLKEENSRLKKELKATNKGNQRLREVYDLALQDIGNVKDKLIRCSNCKHSPKSHSCKYPDAKFSNSYTPCSSWEWDGKYYNPRRKLPTKEQE